MVIHRIRVHDRGKHVICYLDDFKVKAGRIFKGAGGRPPRAGLELSARSYPMAATTGVPDLVEASPRAKRTISEVEADMNQFKKFTPFTAVS